MNPPASLTIGPAHHCRKFSPLITSIASLLLAASSPVTAEGGLLWDLRAVSISGVGGVVNDTKTVTLGASAGPGTVITLELWAVVTGSDSIINETFQAGLGTILSSPGTLANRDTGVAGNLALADLSTTNPLLGTLSNSLLPTWKNGFFNDGPIVDLDGDGDLDVGGNSASSTASYMIARAAAPQDGTGLSPNDFRMLSNGREFKISFATFTLSSVSVGTPIGLNFVVPAFENPLAEFTRAIFGADGVARNGADAQLSVAAPVMLRPAASSWIGTGGGSWSQTANWSNGVPDSSGISAIFGPAIIAPAAVTLDGDKVVFSLVLDSTNAYSIGQGSGGVLRIHRGINVSAGSHAISAPVNLMAQGIGVDITNSADTLTISGFVSGSGGWSKTGEGRLVLTGPGISGGNTVVSAGIMELNTTGENAIAANVSIAGGTLRLLQSNQIADLRNVNVAGGTFELGAFTETVNGVQMTAGAITGPGTLTSLTDIALQDGIVSAALAGAMAVNKTTAGTVTLSAVNSYTGATTVSGGILQFEASGGNAVPGAVTVAGGTLRLLKSDQIADTSFLNVSSGTFDLGSNAETVGVLRLGNAAITGTGTLTSLTTYDIRGGTVSARLAGAVGLTKSNFESAVLAGANTYTGLTTVSAGILQLNASGANAIAGDVSVAGGALRVSQANQIADTSAVTVQSGTFELSGAETVATLRLMGGGITGPGALTSLGGYLVESGVITAPLLGNVPLTKSAGGTVTFSGANTYTGITTVNSGILALNSATGANAISGNVAINFGTLRLMTSHQIANGASVTLTGGTLDLGATTDTIGALHLFSGAVTGSGILTSLADYDLRSGSVAAGLAGNFGLNKTTAGEVTLAGANSYAGTTTVSGGILQLNLNNPTGGNAIPGNVTVSGSTLRLLRSEQIADAGSLTLTNSTLDLGANGETVAAVHLIDGTISGTAASYLISRSAFDLQSGTVTARLAGPAGVHKTTSGTVTLTGANFYNGPTTVSGGRLIVLGPSQSSSFLVESGTLKLDGQNIFLGSNSLRANAGGTIEYGNVTVNGGFLRGPGTHTLLPGGTLNLNGVTSFNSTTLTQSGTANLANVSNGGLIINNATLTWDGGANSSSGRLTVNNTANVRDWTNDGVVTVNSAGVLASAGSDLVSGGGSRITIESGGRLSIETGYSLDLQGSLLVNNGTISGRTEIYYGSTAKGGGAFGSVAILDGGKFSPGNSPGTVTINGVYEWGAGGSVDFEVFDALGAAGATTGWDLAKVIGPDGFLDITAGTTTDTRFTIHVISDDASTALPALNFDSSLSYQWLMVDTAQGITGFDPAEIAIDASEFESGLNGGSFSVTSDSDRLYLNFTPVPEPSSAALAMVGLSVLGWTRRRRA